MNKTTMIIRLIDVILLLLFGFMRVSHIVFNAQIKLPPRGENTAADEEKKEVVLIKLDSKLSEEDNRIIMQFKIPEGEKESKEFSNLDDLQDYLVKRANDNKKFNKPFLVVIEPFPESLIQTTIDVMDICKRWSIEQSIKSPISWSK